MTLSIRGMNSFSACAGSWIITWRRNYSTWGRETASYSLPNSAIAGATQRDHVATALMIISGFAEGEQPHVTHLKKGK
jgi:hypothetical protein